MTTTAPWLLLQLADGAFPSGGFAHSSGLEAFTVLGSREAATSEGTIRFLEGTLRQLGRAALPFVRAAMAAPSRLAELDAAYDATLPFLGPNQASRAQGRALAGAASRVWDAARPVAEHAARGPAHHAPVFGAISAAIGIGPGEALAAYLHGAARGVLSAAVRLGVLGPIEAQRALAERAPLLDTILERAAELRPEDAAQTAPLVEMFAALHDRLDGRMFQS